MKEKLGEVKHRYSHFSVLVSVYSCKIINKEFLNKEKQKLIIPCEIASFPFSNVNHKIFSLWGTATK